MDYLVDTNVLLRSLAFANPHKLVARSAIRTLLQNREELCIAPQNLIEFWSVCTRPEKQNGLGKTVAMTDRFCRFAESFLTFCRNWRHIIGRGGGILNSNDYFRIGYGWEGSAKASSKVFRTQGRLGMGPG